MEIISRALLSNRWQSAAYVDECEQVAQYTLDHLRGIIFEDRQIDCGHIRGQPDDVWLFAVFGVGEPVRQIIGRVDWTARTIEELQM